MTVDATDVEDALGSTELTSTQLDALIGPAGRMYDPLIKGESVNTDVRDDVVTQLAAHLVSIGPDRQISSGSEGDGQISFEGETGKGLRATTHGQTAITLDPTGKLATTDKAAPTVSVPDAKGLRD